MHGTINIKLIASDFASMYAGKSLTTHSERRCTHSHVWRASSPVNRATHYHKCPRWARPTRKSVSQIARVGLCHLSPPARSLVTAVHSSTMRSPRFHGAKRAIRSRSFFPPSSRAAGVTFPGTLVRFFTKTVR